MSNLRTTLDHLASVFASSVLDAIRGASLQEILAESGAAAPRGRARGAEASLAVENHAASSSPTGARRRRGRLARRSAGDISQIVDGIVQLLERRPDGLRAEQIRAELGLEAKELPRPIAEALASKRIAKQGQKRATTYFARGAGGSGSRAAAKSNGAGRGRGASAGTTKKSAGKRGRATGKRAGKTVGKAAKSAGRKAGRSSASAEGSNSAAEAV